MVAYLIAEIDVTDAVAYEPYKKAASESIARHGGKYIARGGKTVSLEGAPPKCLVILEFPSLDAAKRFQGGTEEDFRRCLYAPDLHDPDVIIRTGGEQRLSNYLPWQAAYSELVFREEMWPDFSRAAFTDSLTRFSSRSRRFGGRAADAPPTEAPDAAHQLALRRVTTAVDDRSIR